MHFKSNKYMLHGILSAQWHCHKTRPSPVSCLIKRQLVREKSRQAKHYFRTHDMHALALVFVGTTKYFSLVKLSNFEWFWDQVCQNGRDFTKTSAKMLKMAPHTPP